MIIYLLTFYLFVDIKNIFRITHAKHSAASKTNLLTLTKMHVQPERLYFLFAFCASIGIIDGDRCDRKTPKNVFK